MEPSKKSWCILSIGKPPIGAVCRFIGRIEDIPEGYVLADGKNGTPDLRATYPDMLYVQRIA